MSALDAEKRCQLVLAMCAVNFCGRKGHHHLVRVLCRLLIYGIDQRQRAMCVLAFELFRFNPDGEEFGSQVSRLGLCEIEIAFVSCWRSGHIEVVVEQALRSVGVTIYYQR